MNQTPLSPRDRPDRTTMIMAALLAGVTIVMLAVVYFMRGGSETPIVRINEGRVFGTPAQASQPPLSQPPLPQAQPEQPGPAADSLAFITNKEPFPQVAGNGPAGTSTVPVGERNREKQFLAQYDGTIKQYQARLSAICARYREKYPIVKQVDDDFGGLSRYMAIRHRYEADRDLYQWARDTASLPEVRSTIRKYLAKPEAWSVGMDMMLEALKQPPPAPVYKEVQRIMLTDSTMLDITNDIGRDVQSDLPIAVTSMAGKDTAPLQKVMTDLSLDKKSPH